MREMARCLTDGSRVAAPKETVETAGRNSEERTGGDREQHDAGPKTSPQHSAHVIPLCRQVRRLLR